jgi:hypothetical protein
MIQLLVNLVGGAIIVVYLVDVSTMLRIAT